MNLEVETIVKMFRIKDQNCWHKAKIAEILCVLQDSLTLTAMILTVRMYAETHGVIS